MPYVCSNAAQYAGSIKGSGQCVAFVQICAGAPQAKVWKKGKRVRSNLTLPRGTAIATFDAMGRYPNNAHGNHAAIYDGQDASQIWVYDQYVGVTVSRRRILFWGGNFPNASRDGDAFFVID
jgi:hypothetical protein